MGRIQRNGGGNPVGVSLEECHAVVTFQLLRGSRMRLAPNPRVFHKLFGSSLLFIRVVSFQKIPPLDLRRFNICLGFPMVNSNEPVAHSFIHSLIHSLCRDSSIRYVMSCNCSVYLSSAATISFIEDEIHFRHFLSFLLSSFIAVEMV